jgi:hypothetical protein
VRKDCWAKPDAGAIEGVPGEFLYNTVGDGEAAVRFYSQSRAAVVSVGSPNACGRIPGDIAVIVAQIKG